MNPPGASSSPSRPAIVHDRLTLRPAPTEWAIRAIEHHHTLAVDPDASATARLLRRELGLPEDGVIIMSGHQAEWWHPGILAKWLAMEAVAAAVNAQGLNAHAVWVVVDQDANEAWKIRVPWRDAGRLNVRSVTLPAAAFEARPGLPAADTPTGMLPPLSAVTERAALQSPGPSGFASVDTGLARMSDFLGVHSGASSLAAQFGAAAKDAVAALVGTPPAGSEATRIVMASRLNVTGMFASVLSALRDDAQSGVSTYNDAATAAPDAKLRPLGMRAGRVETPVWRLRPGMPRGRVDASQLGQISSSELAPRALLMTALLRMGACNLFIHGLGGERYERVNDRWIQAWLKTAIAAPSFPPAPVAVASATRFIPALAEGSPPPTAEQITSLQWTAHHARHAPGVLGDAARETERRRLVLRIRTARREGRSPRESYLELHRFLEAHRGANAAALLALAEQAETAAARSTESMIVYARDWAFPLYPPDQLQELRHQILQRLTPPFSPAALP